jgi:acetyl-CoA/propionyl-CoA carboxylase biotin carboxyl carrier protein
VPTVIPLHRAVVTDPAFAPELADPPGSFAVHTQWLETEFVNGIPPFTGTATNGGDRESDRETITVELDGKRLEVSLPLSLRAGTPSSNGKPRRRRAGPTRGPATDDALLSPMQGTVIKVAVEEGQAINEGDQIVVLEAMKMEEQVTAHRSGTVHGLAAAVGSAISAGTTICTIVDTKRGDMT